MFLMRVTYLPTGRTAKLDLSELGITGSAEVLSGGYPRHLLGLGSTQRLSRAGALKLLTAANKEGRAEYGDFRLERLSITRD